MKRLVAVSSSFLPFHGGQEIGLVSLLHGLRQEADWEVSVVTPAYDPAWKREEVYDGIPVIRYPSTVVRYPTQRMPHSFNLAVHMAYARAFIPPLLRRLAPDRILAYFLAPTAHTATRYARAHGIPSVLFLGGSDVFTRGWPVWGAMRGAMRDADRVLATSRFVRDSARMCLRLPDKPVDLLPYPIDLRRFPCVPPPPRSGTLRLLCVQRLVPLKGTRILLLALARAMAGGPAAVHLDVVGDGVQRAELEALAGSLGISAAVTFHGERPEDEVAGFYQRADVFCFPTLAEGFGIVLLEAMATGRIVLASDCSAIPEILDHGRRGVLVEAGSVDAWANALRRVIGDPDAFAPLARAAREAALAYDVGPVGRRLAALLDDVRAGAGEGA
ncbi:MAG TPA: glycosyltransferase family 4 protein [Longimicrobium sp.]